MKKVFFIFTAALFAVTLFAGTNDVRISAWNMKWFPSGYPITEDKAPNPKQEAKRISSAARFIRWQQTDVALLEEMRDLATCEALISVPTGTNSAPLKTQGWKVNVCSDFECPTNAPVPTHQNAIISKFDAVYTNCVTWTPKDEVIPPRGFVCAVLDINGHLTGLIGLHLKSNFIEDECTNKVFEAQLNRKKRELSAAQVVAFADELLEKEFNGRKVEDVFVCGDFNTSIFDEKYNGEKTVPTFLEKGYEDAHASLPTNNFKRATMPKSKWYPPTTFDYIFHKGAGKLVNPDIAPAQYTSDHQLISVSLSRETEKK